MKCRDGFVSNSSSTSFAIFGAVLPYTEFRSLMNAAGITLENEGDEGYGDYESVTDALATITKGTGLEYHIDEECYVAIGRSYETLNDHETGAEFKIAAMKEVRKALGKHVECECHIETWSTG